jgi:hypothetical protein
MQAMAFKVLRTRGGGHGKRRSEESLSLQRSRVCKVFAPQLVLPPGWGTMDRGPDGIVTESVHEQFLLDWLLVRCSSTQFSEHDRQLTSYSEILIHDLGQP